MLFAMVGKTNLGSEILMRNIGQQSFKGKGLFVWQGKKGLTLGSHSKEQYNEN